MRIALHAEGELAVRTSRVLLAEPDVEVGLFGESSKNSRVHQVDDLGDWDVLVVDEVSSAGRMRMDAAFALRIPVVLATEESTMDEPLLTIVTGVLEGARLATALAESELGGTAEVIDAQLAWTVPGHPLEDGVAVTFPDPIGPLWADRGALPKTDYPASGLAAPIDGGWRGVTARLTTGTDEGVHQQIYGLADDRNFLNGIVLAAAALTAAEGAYSAGLNGPGAPDGVFLRRAQRSGLDIASFTPA